MDHWGFHVGQIPTPIKETRQQFWHTWGREDCLQATSAWGHRYGLRKEVAYTRSTQTSSQPGRKITWGGRTRTLVLAGSNLLLTFKIIAYFGCQKTPELFGSVKPECGTGAGRGSQSEFLKVQRKTEKLQFCDLPPACPPNSTTLSLLWSDAVEPRSEIFNLRWIRHKGYSIISIK